MINWMLVNKKLSDLRENPKNPRILTKDQAKHLQASIERFGISDKPVINQDGMIIGGHQRIKILKKMGYSHIECWVPEIPLNDNEVDELCIRLNKNSGEWDWDCLANAWDGDDLIAWGFTDKELIGSEDNTQEIESISDNKEEELTTCPSCGHEF